MLSAIRSILALVLVITAGGATAQVPGQSGASVRPPVISELSVMDRRYMEQQRALMDDLVRQELGASLGHGTEQDLRTLQRLLDERVIHNDETRKLQAMGIVLGDLLAEDLNMRWVIYEDNVGRSRALRLRDTDNYLFPVTMISRRREAGNERPVPEIYQKAYDIIDEIRGPLPYQ